MATASVESSEPCPAEVNTKCHPQFIEVHKDKRTVTYYLVIFFVKFITVIDGCEVQNANLSNRYTGKGSHTDYGSVQADTHAPPTKLVYYFEVKVVDTGLRGNITVGLSDKSFLLNRQPGWEPNSFGYRGEDGKKFCGSSRGESYGKTFGRDDVIGCGIHFLQQYVFFTKNGEFLGKAADLGPSPEYYPTVGLHSPGESVTRTC